MSILIRYGTDTAGIVIGKLKCASTRADHMIRGIA